MSVSILIPAFRPTFLRQTIASALTQGLEDFEIIVSDDSGGEALAPIVEQFRDPRLRYVRTAGRTGAAANCRSLWPQATGERMIFLLDDDLLLPHGLPELSAQMDAHPEAAFCFAQRFMVDGAGRLFAEPPPPRESPLVADHRQLVRNMVPPLTNVVGEFSNVLINRTIGLTIEDMLTYRGFDMRVMGDMAFYFNASRKGPAVGISPPVGSFRVHGDQISSMENPKLFFLLVEWELFLRGEYADGFLTPDEGLAAAGKLRSAYQRWAPSIPIFQTRIAPLDELAERIRAGERELFTEAFRADLEALADHFDGPGQG